MKYQLKEIVKVLIADDHDVYRDGLQMLLTRDKMIQVCGQAVNGEDLVKKAKKKQPDIIITDLRMPVMGGVEAIRELSVARPLIRSIALSMFDEEDLVIRALEAGAYGYVIKNASRGEIVNAIMTVHAGKPYYCLSTSSQLAKKISLCDFNPYRLRKAIAFNEKEKQIINLVCDERSSKEIADTMEMNYRTIERIRADILGKMNVKNSAGVAIYAVKNELYGLG